MRVALVLPPQALEPAFLARCVQRARAFFGSEPEILAADGAMDGQAFREEVRLPEDMALVFVRHPDTGECGGRPDREVPGGTVFTLEYGARLLQWQGPPFDPEAPAGARQVFDRLAPAFNAYAFGVHYPFPFGMRSRVTGLGPMDPVGHRIDLDLEALARREAHHKVVAVFGGSCAFSILCLHHEMFPQVLEGLLNATMVGRNRTERFTVLNFGSPAAGVLDEMFSYLLYADRLKPEFVLAHDGFNDFIHGLVNDPLLVSRFHISYWPPLETWASLLARTQEPGPEHHPNYRMFNPPRQVLKAFVDRKLQFHDLVTSKGRKFIWGIQPFLLSKKALSSREAAYLRGLRAGRIAESEVLPVYERLRFLYDEYRRSVILPSRVESVVNFDVEFSVLGEEVTLFGDFAHATPDGDRLVADAYAREILKAYQGEGS